MHFEENQLSLCSIGISPLPTPHPSILQHTSVRSSTTLYCRFNLDMGRSHSFGSNARDKERLIQTRFRSVFPAERVKLPRTLTRRLILQKARCHPKHGLQLLVGDTVSGTFSLPSRGAFHLSLTVLLRYRWQRVFSLRRWSSQIPTRFLVSRGTRVSARIDSFLGTGLSPPMVSLPRLFP